MRLSEIGEKEIVNLNDGERFGRLADAELLIDEKYGKIKALQVRDFRTSGIISPAFLTMILSPILISFSSIKS